jgi:hypothetical protein
MTTQHIKEVRKSQKRSCQGRRLFRRACLYTTSFSIDGRTDRVLTVLHNRLCYDKYLPLQSNLTGRNVKQIRAFVSWCCARTEFRGTWQVFSGLHTSPHCHTQHLILTQAVRLHAGGRVYCVAEETVPRHLVAHNTSYAGTCNTEQQGR